MRCPLLYARAYDDRHLHYTPTATFPATHLPPLTPLLMYIDNDQTLTKQSKGRRARVNKQSTVSIANKISCSCDVKRHRTWQTQIALQTQVSEIRQLLTIAIYVRPPPKPNTLETMRHTNESIKVHRFVNSAFKGHESRLTKK